MAENYRTADFDEVAGNITGNTKVTVLLGAGASVTGDIPLAAGLVQRALETYPWLVGKVGKTPGYSQCMDELNTGQQQALVRKVCNTAKVNWAHVALAQLMSKGIVTRVLTTNFDPLLVRACAMLAEFPAVYDLAVTESFTTSLVARKAILYLHGQHTGMVQFHTPDRYDSEKVRAREAAAIDAANDGQMWIVIGYSGDNDPLIKVLGSKDFPFGLYWIAYRDQPPAATVITNLL